MEEWRDIPGYEGRYQVSDMGRVRSVPHFVRHSRDALRRVPGRILKPNPSRQRQPSYLNVGLANSTKKVHKLVLLAFVGPCPPGMEAAHDDGDSWNNRLTNLSYKSAKDNSADRRRHGTQPRGEQIHSAKITTAGVESIRALRELGLTHKAIGDKLGASRGIVRDVLNRKTWTHV